MDKKYGTHVGSSTIEARTTEVEYPLSKACHNLNARGLQPPHPSMAEGGLQRNAFERQHDALQHRHADLRHSRFAARARCTTRAATLHATTNSEQHTEHGNSSELGKGTQGTTQLAASATSTHHIFLPTI